MGEVGEKRGGQDVGIVFVAKCGREERPQFGANREWVIVVIIFVIIKIVVVDVHFGGRRGGRVERRDLGVRTSRGRRF